MAEWVVVAGGAVQDTSNDVYVFDLDTVPEMDEEDLEQVLENATDAGVQTVVETVRKRLDALTPDVRGIQQKVPEGDWEW